MRILYVNSLYSPDFGGGAEFTLKILAESMRDAGHEVAVACTAKASAVRRDVVEGISVYRVPPNNLYWQNDRHEKSALRKFCWHFLDRRNEAMLRELKKIVSEFNPEIISFHNLSGWSFAAWRAATECSIPSVQVLHDYYLRCPKATCFKGGKTCITQCAECSLFRIGVKAASSKLNAVVGVSTDILNKFQEWGYFPEVKAKAINNVRIITGKASSGMRPESVGLVFGYIGTLAPSKGIEWLLEQFSLLEAECNLVIAGTGESSYVEFLRAKYRSAKISFLGFIASEDFYDLIDILVVPSIWDEPLGMVAVEGSANGKPLIATNRGGLKDILRSNQNGLICDPEVPQSLGQALQMLTADRQLVRRLAENSRAAVQHFLRPERMSNEYLQLYESLVDKREN